MGLTHDDAEAHVGQPLLAESNQRFEKPIDSIVRACRDPVWTDPDEKAPWLERKRAHLVALQRVTPDVMLGTAAYTFENSRAIITDIQSRARSTWTAPLRDAITGRSGLGVKAGSNRLRARVRRIRSPARTPARPRLQVRHRRT